MKDVIPHIIIIYDIKEKLCENKETRPKYTRSSCKNKIALLITGLLCCHL